LDVILRGTSCHDLTNEAAPSSCNLDASAAKSILALQNSPGAAPGLKARCQRWDAISAL